MTVFGGSFLKLLMKTIGKFTESRNCEKASSVFGVFESIMAMYCAAAFLVNATWKRTLFPLGKKGEKPCAPK